MRSSLCAMVMGLAAASGFQLNAAARPTLPLRARTITATEDEDAVKSEEATPEQAGYSTFYDDESGDQPIKYADGTKKPEISNSMREKLINESRGLGADPGAKNPFLLVFGGVGVFVVLGALAVNM